MKTLAATQTMKRGLLGTRATTNRDTSQNTRVSPWP